MMIFPTTTAIAAVSVVVGGSIVIATNRLASDFCVGKEPRTFANDVNREEDVTSLEIMASLEDLAAKRPDVVARRGGAVARRGSYDRRNPIMISSLCDMMEWIHALTTWFVVRVVQPSLWARRPFGRLCRVSTWRGMKLQSPSCVLYQPFPELTRRACGHILGFTCGVFTLLGIAFSSTFVLLSGLVVLSAASYVVLVRGYDDRNRYDTSDASSTSSWIAEIRGGVYVGYEGIVFGLDRTECAKNRSWILLDGHADRSALAKLVRKSSTPRHVQWHSTWHRVRCWGGPESFCQERCDRHERGTSGGVIHPRYANVRRPQCVARATSMVRCSTLVVAVQFHHGYFHWITERLPVLCRLLPFVIDNPRAQLLVDLSFTGLEDTASNPWAMQYLELCCNSLSRDRATWSRVRSQILPYRADRVYHADRVVVTKAIPTFHSHRTDLLLVRRTLVDCDHDKDADAPRTILLVRRIGAAARQLSNRDDVFSTLKRCAFSYVNSEGRRVPYRVQVVDFESMPVSEQIDVCRKARVLIGIHGAGLANMIWCPSDCAVLEIRPARPRFFRYLFWHLASSLRLPYAAVVVDGCWSSKSVRADPSKVTLAVSRLLLSS